MIARDALRAKDRGIVSTGGLIVANTLVGSVLGFLFWFAAARVFDSVSLGVGAGLVAAVTLIASLADLGMGTLAIRFLPKVGTDVGHFIDAMVTVVGVTAAVLAIGFGLTAQIWSGPSPTQVSPIALAVLICCAVAFSIGQLGDKILIALGAPRMMLAKNVISGAIRVGLLPVLAFAGPTAFIGSLGIGSAVGLVVAAGFAGRIVDDRYRPKFTLRLGILRSKIAYTLGNHLSVLAWGAPALLYPFVVLLVLGPAANGRFYVTWMLANLVYVVPTAASTAWFSKASASSEVGSQGLWTALVGTLATLGAVVLPIAIIGPALLRLFGSVYTPELGDLLLLLLAAAFPFAINNAILFYHRLSHRPAAVTLLACAIASTCLFLAGAFAMATGLVGVGLGWLVGQSAGVLLSLASYRVVSRRASSDELREAAEEF